LLIDTFVEYTDEGLWLVMASFQYYEKHCQDIAAQRKQSSSMPDIAITVLSDFINRYEQRIIEYDTEEFTVDRFCTKK
jgi:hypothetical protein